ncbi:UDP-glucosyltransferase [Senna tora]|uniref:UDP-glucosyltransferase n=1 Tax=Senna tora TaxID=362788 RepID=A0A834WV57_9FABA|nr:UDP-glucosyltransferase [Senna tora]
MPRLSLPSTRTHNTITSILKAFGQKDVKVRLVSSIFFFKKLPMKDISSNNKNVELEAISDRYDEAGYDEAESFDAYVDSFRRVGSRSLPKLIRKLERRGTCVDCVVYDSHFPWVLDVARELGLLCASFLTQPCIVGCIYLHAQWKWLELPLDKEEKVGISLLGLSLLAPSDLPLFLYRMFKRNDEACMKWLNEKPKRSVVYVSFGSLANLSENQMEEMAWGLRESQCFLLWVVRESEESKLPKDFTKMTSSEKGIIVTWCPQLQVLSHEAVGCFVTHCGWNSTLEALCLGVPMVGSHSGQVKTRMRSLLRMFERSESRLKLIRKGVSRDKKRLRKEVKLRKQESQASTSIKRLYDTVEELTSSSDSSSEIEDMAVERTWRALNVPPAD